MARYRKEVELDGARVLYILRRQGKTQSDLAFDIRMDRGNLSKALKSGGCSVTTLHEIADALQVAPGELVVKGANTPGSVARRHRILAGFSVPDLADRSGVSSSTIAKVERDATGLTAFNAICLAQALDMTVEKYLGYER